MQDDLPRTPPPPIARTPISVEAAVVARPPLSTLAVVAFILGLAGLCPLAGLPAILLGFVAHARITRGHRRLRGRGLALWAVALGSATSLAWLGVWNHVGSRMLEVLSSRMETAITTTMSAAAAGDVDAVLGVLDGPAVDRDGLDSLISQAAEAGVEAESISVTRFEQAEAGLTPLIIADVRVLMNDGEIWNGEVSFRLRPPAYRGMSIEDLAAEPRMVSMFVRGPNGRALRYPPPNVESSSTSEGEKSESEPSDAPSSIQP